MSQSTRIDKICNCPKVLGDGQNGLTQKNYFQPGKSVTKYEINLPGLLKKNQTKTARLIPNGS